MAGQNEKVVFVAVVNRKKDFEIAKKQHWYRIPVKHAPKKKAHYLKNKTIPVQMTPITNLIWEPLKPLLTRLRIDIGGESDLGLPPWRNC